MIDSKVSLETRWEKIHANLQELVSGQQYKTWFKSMRLHGFANDIYTFMVPNSFLKDWIAKYYSNILLNAVKRATGKDGDITIRLEIGCIEDRRVKNEPGKGENINDSAFHVAEKTVPASSSSSKELASSKEQAVKQSDEFFLNPNYTFDKFVVGPSNRLSYAASMAVAETATRPYNPLFIHGTSGLGKTHLLQGICHKLLAQNSSKKILFLSCETFINHFISAVERGDLDKFRHKYRHIDLFLIDDVHLLAHKGRTQEEFFHTFNSLYNRGKQIVLSSDSQPSNIPTLEERLVSRFKWGLVTNISPPDFETRCAILMMKSRIRGVKVPEDVIAFLAENIENNIRELEGAITKVTGYATLMNRKLDIDMALEAMKDVIKRDARIVSIDHIVRTVTEKFEVKLSDIQSKKRFKSIALPRQIAMYIIKNLTTHSLQEIGTYFGGRDHTTVLYACRRIEERVKSDKQFDVLINELVQQITNKA